MADFTCTDNLASNGILKFDANAYINGTSPRYVGNPTGESYLPGSEPYGKQPEFTKGSGYLSQPSSDSFRSSTAETEKSPINFKSALLAGGLLAGAAYLMNKKSKGSKNNKKNVEKEAETKTKGSEKTETKAKAKANVEAKAKTEKEAKGIFSKVKNFFGKTKEGGSKLGKGMKYGAIAAVGLLALNKIYEVVKGGSAEPSEAAGLPGGSKSALGANSAE